MKVAAIPTVTLSRMPGDCVTSQLRIRCPCTRARRACSDINYPTYLHEALCGLPMRCAGSAAQSTRSDLITLCGSFHAAAKFGRAAFERLRPLKPHPPRLRETPKLLQERPPRQWFHPQEHDSVG